MSRKGFQREEMYLSSGHHSWALPSCPAAVCSVPGGATYSPRLTLLKASAGIHEGSVPVAFILFSQPTDLETPAGLGGVSPAKVILKRKYQGNSIRKNGLWEVNSAS